MVSRISLKHCFGVLGKITATKDFKTGGYTGGAHHPAMLEGSEWGRVLEVHSSPRIYKHAGKAREYKGR